jgi:hypothetical protein
MKPPNGGATKLPNEMNASAMPSALDRSPLLTHKNVKNMLFEKQIEQKIKLLNAKNFLKTEISIF